MANFRKRNLIFADVPNQCKIFGDEEYKKKVYTSYRRVWVAEPVEGTWKQPRAGRYRVI